VETFIVDVLDGALSKFSILYSATNLILPYYCGNKGDLVYLVKNQMKIHNDEALNPVLYSSKPD
jgi:hypothetical protein